jgi:transposase InsO family protein
MNQGLSRDKCLDITGLSKHQFYHPLCGKKPGRKGSVTTRYRDPLTSVEQEVDNAQVVEKIIEIKLNPDLANAYRMITKTLQLEGYYINHKKVYRLMDEQMLLEEPRKRTGRNFVQYGRVAPQNPLSILEMDIKYFWIHGARKYAFVLTVMDTFTRYVLKWQIGYSMKAIQIKEAWEYVIANYLQPAGLRERDVNVEIRNDNGKQFSAHMLTAFFKENQIDHKFTHPYTPEENGHVESFHNILGKALENELFADLHALEKRLQKFYASYNNDRCHGSIAGLPPAKFWALFDLNKIEVIKLSNNRLRFKLKVAYQEVVSIPEINRYRYRVIGA